MARPEAPVDHNIPELGDLAEYLRSMRRQAGLTYTELAKESCYSAATLKRAASGKHLPAVAVVIQYVLMCIMLDPQPADDRGLKIVDLWTKAARAFDRSRMAARRSNVLPKPQYVRDEGDLSGALRDVWACSGRPSTRSVEKASRGQVPRSTAHVISTAHAVPRDFRQYAAYLRVCGITGKALEPWFRAWFKVRGVPSDLQSGFTALKDDADAQAAYVSAHTQATGSAISVAELVERLTATLAQVKTVSRESPHTRKVARWDAAPVEDMPYMYVREHPGGSGTHVCNEVLHGSKKPVLDARTARYLVHLQRYIPPRQLRFFRETEECLYRDLLADRPSAAPQAVTEALRRSNNNRS
ncbi:multiprotein-bridging factor 1 family protein [Streptomyces sp. NPDC048171]|uniref:helix-turn-helix domain-containing protein n=1 Tax=Streptomyces sp. NPDC048171 TaxID=3365504 RepID=UPI00372417C5